MQTRAQGGGESHECDRCGETFPTEQELQQHVADRHADAPDSGGVTDSAVPAGTGGSRTESAGGMVQSE